MYPKMSERQIFVSNSVASKNLQNLPLFFVRVSVYSCLSKNHRCPKPGIMNHTITDGFLLKVFSGMPINQFNFLNQFSTQYSKTNLYLFHFHLVEIIFIGSISFYVNYKARN
jgi:hypothetical protein